MFESLGRDLKYALRRLRSSWVRALKEAGMKPGDFDEARERLAQRKEYKPKVPAEPGLPWWKQPRPAATSTPRQPASAPASLGGL